MTVSEFEQGYACAVASIVSSHGCSTEAKEALEAGGLTSVMKMRRAGVSDYDIQILRPLVKEIQAYNKRMQKRESERKDG